MSLKTLCVYTVHSDFNYYHNCLVVGLVMQMQPDVSCTTTQRCQAQLRLL